MDEYGYKKTVFSSSATVYGTLQYLPLDEAHPFAPVNPYGQTKLIVENILRDLRMFMDEKRFYCNIYLSIEFYYK